MSGYAFLDWASRMTMALLGVILKCAPELSQSEAHSRLYCSQGRPTEIRDLLVTHLSKVGEPDDLFLLGREGAQRFFNSGTLELPRRAFDWIVAVEEWIVAQRYALLHR